MTNTTDTEVKNAIAVAALSAHELALVGGDLSKLSAEERHALYMRTCSSLGLNPLTQPFEYIQLNGKLRLYARKDCTDQLRSIRKVSIIISSRERLEDVYVVTARATLPDGRTDESIGAVPIANLKGDGLANALMKAETKARRRVTLSICGLGLLDESEVASIPDARPPALDAAGVLAAVKSLPPPPATTPTLEAVAEVVPADPPSGGLAVVQAYQRDIEDADSADLLNKLAAVIKNDKSVGKKHAEYLRGQWAKRMGELTKNGGAK